MERIQKLSNGWRSATENVIRFEELDLADVRELFKETYSVLDEFSKENLVPKQISELLIEMNDFSWWVSDLADTPMYVFYEEIIKLVSALNRYFLTRDYDIRVIENTIEKIRSDYKKYE